MLALTVCKFVCVCMCFRKKRDTEIEMRGARSEREERGGDNIHMRTCVCVSDYAHVLARKWCAVYKESH